MSRHLYNFKYIKLFATMNNISLICFLISIVFFACSQKTVSQSHNGTTTTKNPYRKVIIRSSGTQTPPPATNKVPGKVATTPTTTPPTRQPVPQPAPQPTVPQPRPQQPVSTTTPTEPRNNSYNNHNPVPLPSKPALRMGPARLEQYLPILRYKRVGLVVNQTSTVGDAHLADVLLSQQINVQKVFAPEHGFRGKADAGEKVSNSRDIKTGLPIISLYGKNKKPTAEQLRGLEVVVFDIQDVGARFYTYISTMHYVMEACAENGISVVVLDRPNPNGHYVDGPILEPDYQSFVGMHRIPIVHGMTVGELANMINNEGWLKNGVRCHLSIIPCEGYDHTTFYDLPIKPSPNLPNSRSIHLYPSLCLFEGTVMSVGRGTDQQFQIIGNPQLRNMPFQFRPISKPGAKYPKHENKTCYGYDLSNMPISYLRQNRQLNLDWLLQMYQAYPDKANFFNKNNFFNKLAGNSRLQQQIKSGMTETQIRATWQADLDHFKQIRKQYLIYPDFE